MTNERLKEILGMVMDDRSSCFLCNRFTRLRIKRFVDESESKFVIDYMFERRPFIEREFFWWGSIHSIGYEAWLQAKHDWLQKLIDEL